MRVAVAVFLGTVTGAMILFLVLHYGKREKAQPALFDVEMDIAERFDALLYDEIRIKAQELICSRAALRRLPK